MKTQTFDKLRCSKVNNPVKKEKIGLFFLPNISMLSFVFCFFFTNNYIIPTEFLSFKDGNFEVY